MHPRRKLAVIAAVAGLLGAGGALAQPTLSTPGGGTGNADMDHSRMGGGQGAGSPAGGRITGNSGEGGPEVRHGHAPVPETRQETRP
ncbi:hypothetical protein OFC49_33440, partial [Escherichia coli]|nr:hypothetical protein [Escherichia coli]